MSSALDDKRQRPWRPPSSARHWTTTATVVTLLLLTMMVCMSTVYGLSDDLVHVVNIRVYGADKSDSSCPIKCSGTLITSTMVLTAASCTEHTYTFENTDVTTIFSTKPSVMTISTPKPSVMTTSTPKPLNATTMIMPTVTKEALTTYKTEVPNKNENKGKNVMQRGEAVEEGSIRVYLSSPTPKLQRFVIRKFVNPNWEWKTKVANLVLLRLNSYFPNYFRSNINSLLDDTWARLPAMLYFKGFGKMNVKLYPEQPIDDLDARRILRVYFGDKQCPTVKNGKVSNNDYHWWSFLCTTSDHTRNITDNTLCSEDIGGPLFRILNNLPTLLGVFSHAYHVKYPMCATKLCYIQDTAPYPCETERGLLYYKHTALIGRYAYWVNQTVEEEYRVETSTPTCPTEPTIPNQVTTPVDKDYDMDMYSDRRVMVANYKVCPKYRASSATVAVTASAAVVGAAMLATRSCWSA